LSDINFFEGIKKNTPQKKAAGVIKICGIIFILILLLIGGAYSYILFQGKNTDNDINKISSQIAKIEQENPGLDQIAYKKKKLQALKSYEKQAQEFLMSVKVYPSIDRALILNVEKRKPAGIAIVSMEYKSGVLRITGLASNIFLPAEFAKNLGDYELIEKINYTGNSIASEETKDLQFVIDCQLKGGHL